MKLQTTMDSSAQPNLPVNGSLTVTYIGSWVVALLVSGMSLAGLIAPTAIYPTQDLLQSFMANDVVNLAIGVPILLLSMWWTRHDKLIGLLFWPGALFYTLYNYLIFLLAMPLSSMYLLCLLLVTTSIYTMINLLGRIDRADVQQRLSGVVPERLGGSVLAGLGSLFVLRVIAEFVGALVNEVVLPPTEMALLTIDFITNPVWVIGGISLWQRKSFGYVVGAGLLFQGSMLFIGLIAFLILQPILTDAPLTLVDVLVVFVMGFICFIPSAMFARSIAKA